MENTSKTIAIDYAHRLWNKKNLGVIDEYFTDSTKIHSLLGDFKGIAAMKEIAQVWITGFPDLSLHDNLVITENDLISIQWSAKGTHKGEFKGHKPTGKPIAYSGVTVYRIKNGKIIEYWAYIDMQHLLSQIS